jgi:iron(III) transport system ATP-binding protein
VQQRVEELVRLVGLPGSEGKVPSQLSGGQQQRIALARALATSPGLLLLDEPLSALDAIVRVHLRQEIRSLQRKLGVTTIMVTHDQEEALSVADRIVVMNHGVIEQVGSPEKVYREPASPFVADFVGRVNVLSGHVDAAGCLRVGDAVLELASAPGQPQARGGDIKVYLRPEDVLARPLPPGGTADQAFEPGASNVLAARIDKIEFLGAYCLVRVTSGTLGEQGITTVLSMNFLAEHGLGVGSALALRLLPDRLRCFDQ